MEKVLTFLGKDGTFGPQNTSAYAIVSNRLTLIDCGYTVFPQLQKMSILNEVMGIDVIITHLHADHAGSLSQLALFTQRELKYPINIITQCESIDTFMTITGADKNSFATGLSKDCYTRNKKFVEFIQTSNTKKLDCYGFSCLINHRHVVYTGDTTTLKPFIGYLEKGTQFFVDASMGCRNYFRLKENLPLLEKLSGDGVHVCLMHILDEPELRELIKGTKIRICDE